MSRLRRSKYTLCNSCTEDPSFWVRSCLCPCIALGYNYSLREGEDEDKWKNLACCLSFPCCLGIICGGFALLPLYACGQRQNNRRTIALDPATSTNCVQDLLISLFCFPCLITQDHLDLLDWRVNPTAPFIPPEQQMMTLDKQRATTTGGIKDRFCMDSPGEVRGALLGDGESTVITPQTHTTNDGQVNKDSAPPSRRMSISSQDGTPVTPNSKDGGVSHLERHRPAPIVTTPRPPVKIEGKAKEPEKVEKDDNLVRIHLSPKEKEGPR